MCKLCMFEIFSIRSMRSRSQESTRLFALVKWFAFVFVCLVYLFVSFSIHTQRETFVIDGRWFASSFSWIKIIFRFSLHSSFFRLLFNSHLICIIVFSSCSILYVFTASVRTSTFVRIRLFVFQKRSQSIIFRCTIDSTFWCIRPCCVEFEHSCVCVSSWEAYKIKTK